PPVSEQTPSPSPPHIIAPPARRNTWPGMVFGPPGDANVPIPKPARTPSTPADAVGSPSPPVAAFEPTPPSPTVGDAAPPAAPPREAVSPSPPIAAPPIPEPSPAPPPVASAPAASAAHEATVPP